MTDLTLPDRIRAILQDTQAALSDVEHMNDKLSAENKALREQIAGAAEFMSDKADELDFAVQHWGKPFDTGNVEDTSGELHDMAASLKSSLQVKS